MAVMMRAITALSVVGLLAAAPAQARDWHGRGGGGWHGGYHRGGGAGPAIAAGLIGLGVGAAIASSAAPPPAYYGPAPGYYTPPPPAVYYGY